MMNIITSLSAENRLNYLTSRLKACAEGWADIKMKSQSTVYVDGDILLQNRYNTATLIVPEQFLFETERSMYSLLGARKIAVTDITGFSKLASNVIKKHGAPKLYADDIVKTVTMYKTLSRLKTTLGIQPTYDYARKMLHIVADFKSAAITTDILRKTAAHVSLGEVLSTKLSDITEIYSTYCETLDADFTDKLDDNAIASELIGQYDCFAGRDIFIHEFDSFSESQIGLIKALERSANSVSIILRTDSKISEISEFRAVNWLIKRIEREIPCEFTDLGGASFSPDMELWTADNVCDECEFVAAEIRRLITQAGYTCNEIAVIACDQSVIPRLKEAMSEYDIQSYADLPEPIISKPMTRFIISALEAVNLNTPELLSYIRSGFIRVRFDLENYDIPKNLMFGKFHGKDGRYNLCGKYEFAAGGFKSRLTKRLSKRSMDLLERAAHRYALTRREWGNTFPNQNRDLSALENLRVEIVKPLVILKESCQDTTGEKITEALCEFLIETMQIQRTVLGLSCGFEMSENILDIQSKNITDEFRQIWDLIIDVFESLHASLEGFYVSLSDYTQLLRGVFSSVNIAKPPQVLDAVSIGDLERSRLTDVGIAFVMGANSGSFPKSAARSSAGEGAFSGKEIEVLTESGLEISAGLEERYNFERLMVNKALTLPSERLYISAPLSNAVWEEILPSPIFSELSENLSLKINTTSDLALSFKARTLKSARRLYATENIKILEKIVGDNFNRVNNTEHCLTPKTAQKIFNFDKFSPTAIETMMSCRFKFFCKYGLAIDIPAAENEEEPIAMERGNIIHYCLEQAIRSLKILGDSDVELERFVETCIKEYRNTKLPYEYALTNRHEYILMSFKNGIVRMLKHIRSDFENSCFKPYDFEKKVDFMLGEIRLTGTIDRVDRLDDYVRVTDYKSGTKEMDFPSVFYGIDMQMLLYLFAVCNSPENKPASALYMPSDGARVSGVLIPENGSLTADVTSERRSWLSSHIPSGIAIHDETLQLQENRYRLESNSPRKSFFKVRNLTPAAYEKLKDYCGKLINTQVKKVKRGNIQAIPIVGADNPSAGIKDGSVCEYCDYSSSCRKNKVKVINKECIERVIQNEKLDS